MILKPLSIEYVDQMVDLQSQGFSDGWSKQSIISGIEKGGLMGVLAFSDQNLVGFLTFSKSIDFCELMDVLVDKNYRRQGIATMLINYLVDSVKGVSPKIFLEVRATNDSAINLYQKHGFIKTSVRKKYYSDGEDAVIMEKELI